jgi:hypothetical protein
MFIHVPPVMCCQILWAFLNNTVKTLSLLPLHTMSQNNEKEGNWNVDCQVTERVPLQRQCLSLLNCRTSQKSVILTAICRVIGSYAILCMFIPEYPFTTLTEAVTLFQGHELHQYLCQQGFTDFEVVRCGSPLQGPQIKKGEFLRHQVFLSIDSYILNLNHIC